MSQVVVNISLLDKANKHNLTINEIVITVALINGYDYLVDTYLKGRTNDQKRAILQPLVRKGLLKVEVLTEEFSLSQYKLTENAAQVLMGTTLVMHDITGVPPVATVEEKSAMDKLVESYLELFPKGIKNGGNKPLRSNATDVRAKLLRFMNKYKHEPEMILKATKNYLDRMRGVYIYCPTAEYFVLKDGSSALATECDMIKNGLSNEEIINPFEKRM